LEETADYCTVIYLLRLTVQLIIIHGAQTLANRKSPRSHHRTTAQTQAAPRDQGRPQPSLNVLPSPLQAHHARGPPTKLPRMVHKTRPRSPRYCMDSTQNSMHCVILYHKKTVLLYYSIKRCFYTFLIINSSENQFTSCNWTFQVEISHYSHFYLVRHYRSNSTFSFYIPQCKWKIH